MIEDKPYWYVAMTQANEAYGLGGMITVMFLAAVFFAVKIYLDINEKR